MLKATANSGQVLLRANATSCVSDLCFVISTLLILLFGLNNQLQENSLYVKRVRALRMIIMNFQKAEFENKVPPVRLRFPHQMTPH